jgi:2-polyprenyl-3-methyl-5-hydroxy-6-metoxy-1,4-benzoquinol methylase
VKAGDTVLQSWRVSKAARHIPSGARVLDVGCGDGALFRMLGDRIESGVGIDAEAVPDDYGPFRFVRGLAPEALPQGSTYDTITLLAVLEHIPRNAQSELAAACRMQLRPGGRVICTVPSPRVDRMIHLGQRLRILDGIAHHEHYGFGPEETTRVFTEHGFQLMVSQRFQLGLNNLFVFEGHDTERG